MIDLIMPEAEYLLRIVIAGICVGMIGYERKNRGKGEGIRTHMIVAMGSSLMMLVSKYGFFDTAGADPSRVASSIVTGVGFLGAGIIYFQNKNIYGLTTAAGVWATMGVGMAIGAGMYIIGIVSAAIIIAAQIVLHKDLKIMHMRTEEEMFFRIVNTQEAVDTITNILKDSDVIIEKVSCKKSEDNLLSLKLRVSLPKDFNPHLIIDMVRNNSFVIMASI